MVDDGRLRVYHSIELIKQWINLPDDSCCSISILIFGMCENTITKMLAKVHLKCRGGVDFYCGREKIIHTATYSTGVSECLERWGKLFRSGNGYAMLAAVHVWQARDTALWLLAVPRPDVLFWCSVLFVAAVLLLILELQPLTVVANLLLGWSSSCVVKLQIRFWISWLQSVL